MGIQNHLSGRNYVMRFFQDKDEVLFRFKSHTLENTKDEGKDDICGENAARPYAEHSLWKFTGETYLLDMSVLRLYLADLKRQMDNLPDYVKTGGIRCSPEGKPREAFVMIDPTLDGWKWSAGGRTERVMASINIRFRYLEPGKAI